MVIVFLLLIINIIIFTQRTKRIIGKLHINVKIVELLVHLVVLIIDHLKKNVSFNEISLQLFNINFYELTKEITNINNYIKYLIYLKEKICEYFGHDVTKKMLILPFSPNLTIYECKCCGKAMNFDEYQNSQFKAICRGTTPESAVNLNHWHMFGSEASKISLPSFSS